MMFNPNADRRLRYESTTHAGAYIGVALDKMGFIAIVEYVLSVNPDGEVIDIDDPDQWFPDRESAEEALALYLLKRSS